MTNEVYLGRLRSWLIVASLRRHCLCWPRSRRTATLLLVALAAVTIAISPETVPLHTPAPANGLCESCDPVDLTIPPDLRHEYWVGLSIAAASREPDAMLIIAPMFALLASALGTGLAQASLRTGNRQDPRRTAEPPSPAPT